MAMSETRVLTADEYSALSAVIKRLGIRGGTMERFIDSRLDKVYDVYLLDGKTVLKKCDSKCRDKNKYDRYFAGHNFPVPKILDSITTGEETYILMEYAAGRDARDCSAEDARRIGKELARIQSHYLITGGHTDAADFYFSEYVSDYCSKVKNYFDDFDSVFRIVEKRFFEAPHSLIHDDLLPINVILGKQRPWIIDWATAGVFPYFLDLARFAFVDNGKEGFFIPYESGMAFLDAYYEEMRKNAGFKIHKKQFYTDAAISAFCQYSMFLYYEDDAGHIESTRDYRYLKEIIEYLRAPLGAGAISGKE